METMKKYNFFFSKRPAEHAVKFGQCIAEHAVYDLCMTYFVIWSESTARLRIKKKINVLWKLANLVTSFLVTDKVTCQPVNVVSDDDLYWSNHAAQ